jgi:hypothetical protein
MWSGSSDHQNETAGFEPAVNGSACFASASAAQLRVPELPLERLRAALHAADSYEEYHDGR